MGVENWADIDFETASSKVSDKLVITHKPSRAQVIDQYRRTVLRNLSEHDSATRSEQTCVEHRRSKVSFYSHVVYVEPCRTHKPRQTIWSCFARAGGNRASAVSAIAVSSRRNQTDSYVGLRCLPRRHATRADLAIARGGESKTPLSLVPASASPVINEHCPYSIFRASFVSVGACTNGTASCRWAFGSSHHRAASPRREPCCVIVVRKRQQ